MKEKKPAKPKLPTKTQLRREKQRAINLVRAEKMHKLRIDAVGDYETNQDLPAINVGCSGWFYWHWKGPFYSRWGETKDWFAHYMKKLHTVELNSTFYNWPTLGIVRSWLRQVGYEDFVYTIKAPELITHIKEFDGTMNLVHDFGYITRLLGSRMGCIIYQLPPTYEYTPKHLKAIISQLELEKRNVVEFRHESWWNEKVYKAFQKANIIFCSSSAPKLPDDLVKTSDEVYIRFHGREQWHDYEYSKKELKQWVEKIKDSGAKRVWAYFNNDANGYAPKNAQLFEKLLKKAKI